MPPLPRCHCHGGRQPSRVVWLAPQVLGLLPVSGTCHGVCQRFFSAEAASCDVQVLGDKELPRTAAGLEALQDFVDTVKVLVDAQGQVLQNSSPEAKQEVGPA